MATASAPPSLAPRLAHAAHPAVVRTAIVGMRARSHGPALLTFEKEARHLAASKAKNKKACTAHRSELLQAPASFPAPAFSTVGRFAGARDYLARVVWPDPQRSRLQQREDVREPCRTDRAMRLVSCKGSRRFQRQSQRPSLRDLPRRTHSSHEPIVYTELLLMPSGAPREPAPSRNQ